MRKLTYFTCLSLLFILFACNSETKTASTKSKPVPKAFTADDAAVRAATYKDSVRAPLQVSESAETITWDDLSKVTFEERLYEEINEYLLFPSFSDHVKSFEGKRVAIEGYVITVSPGRYVLSANPFSSCFFCGNAGPESVVELDLVDSNKTYYSDDFLAFSGEFHLNDTDINMLNYIITEAVPFEVKK
ncbi:MAG: hypothetical protein AAFY71_20155 [Bacteroidota bacterium]